MNIYGERYAEVGLFIGYCRELNIVTDERELEYYEKSGVMLPAARVVYPDDCVVERYRRELDGDYNWTGFDVWPEFADLAEKFPLLLRRFDDLTDEELVHCFDRALDAGEIPIYTYRAAVPTDLGRSTRLKSPSHMGVSWNVRLRSTTTAFGRFTNFTAFSYTHICTGTPI